MIRSAPKWHKPHYCWHRGMCFKVERGIVDMVYWPLVIHPWKP